MYIKDSLRLSVYQFPIMCVNGTRVYPSGNRPAGPQLPLNQPTRVHPFDSRSVVTPAFKSTTRIQIVCAIFNWSMWLLLMFLMLSQLLTAVNSSTHTSAQIRLGQQPSDGLFHIPGFNDEPYNDRAIVCIRNGKRFKAMTVNDALASASTVIEDATGTAVHGFRVVNRSGHFLTDVSTQQWTQTCRLIESTLSYMFTVCETLGYTNLTRDNIRIVDGVSSKIITRIPNSLPILIMPFYDNSLSARYGIPGWDGHTCVFRLAGTYEDPTIVRKYIFGMDRALREDPIVEWLNRPGGTWKNGWYEDPTGTKWNGDIVYIDPPNSDHMRNRQFDPVSQQELNCRNGSECFVRIYISQWAEFRSVTISANVLSVAISNGSRYGLFYYSGTSLTTVQSIYDVSAFISDVSVIELLLRWMMAMIAMHRGYIKGLCAWHNASIGVIANTYSFTILPLLMLPRLKIILAAFLTVGCEFEGPQIALANAWYVMYPSIVDSVLIFASLLNSLAKMTRRRMNDTLVSPTILILSAIHFNRLYIARSPLFGFGGRLTTMVQPDAFENFSFIDLFLPKNAVEMDGNAPFLLFLKLAVLSINLIPFIFSQNMYTQRNQSRGGRPCKIETTLAIRACNVGGFGTSDIYSVYQDLNSTSVALNAYELTRLGYVVVGNRFLITWENWIILTTVSRVRSVYSLWNHRITTYTVELANEETGTNSFEIGSHGKLLNVNDRVLNSVAWWDVDARAFL